MRKPRRKKSNHKSKLRKEEEREKKNTEFGKESKSHHFLPAAFEISRGV